VSRKISRLWVFDDIASAAFQNPSLTTVRQPLRMMGVTAARILLERLKAVKTQGRSLWSPNLLFVNLPALQEI